MRFAWSLTSASSRPRGSCCDSRRGTRERACALKSCRDWSSCRALRSCRGSRNCRARNSRRHRRDERVRRRSSSRCERGRGRRRAPWSTGQSSWPLLPPACASAVECSCSSSHVSLVSSAGYSLSQPLDAQHHRLFKPRIDAHQADGTLRALCRHTHTGCTEKSLFSLHRAAQEIRRVPSAHRDDTLVQRSATRRRPSPVLLPHARQRARCPRRDARWCRGRPWPTR